MAQPSRTFKLRSWDGFELYPLDRVPKSTTIQAALQPRRLIKTCQAKWLDGTEPKNACTIPMNSSFIGSVYASYCDHLNLSFRPDDVWLTICIAFANYASQFSPEVVGEHLGIMTKSIRLEAPPSPASWMEAVDGLAQKLSNLTKKSLDWMVPDFTTTTASDRLVGQLAMMGAAKRLVSYVIPACGIPQVTMQGTRQDWASLLEKVEHIAQCGVQFKLVDLVNWRDILVPILRQFLASYDGEVNELFWQRCVHDGPLCGSGVNGWINAFSPFVKHRWRLNPAADILINHDYGNLDPDVEFQHSATIEVPAEIQHTNGQTESVVFYAGGIVGSFDRASNTISPSFDWCVLSVDRETWQDYSIQRSNIDPKISSYQPPEANINQLLVHYGGRASNIQRSLHPHQLYITSLPDIGPMFESKCRHCKLHIQELCAYYCQKCDYYLCLNCCDDTQT